MAGGKAAGGRGEAGWWQGGGGSQVPQPPSPTGQGDCRQIFLEHPA